MTRITEGPDIVPVMTEISRKYGNGSPGSDFAVAGAMSGNLKSCRDSKTS